MGMQEGSVSDAVRTMALAEGMDPSQPLPLLYRAVELRRATERDRAQEEAALMFNLTCFGIVRGKDMTYWDVAGHLYPKDFVRKQKEKMALDRMRAQQIESLEALKRHMILKEEQRWQRRHRDAAE